MGTFFGILVILFLAFLLFRPLLAPYLQRWLMNRVEDRFRKMAGMPSRKEEKRRQKERQRRGSDTADYFRDASPGPRKPKEPIIPKEYAEDVEFVEIRSYSETTVISEEVSAQDGTRRNVVAESQIEDVEFIEFKE